MDVKYPDITVRLVGTDSNSFALVAKVCAAVRQAEGRVAADAVANEAFESDSPEALLAFLMRTVNVI